MFTYQNGIVRTSVRQLVEFLLREGDIRSQGNLVADVEAMQAGSQIHRKIQKNQKITYRAEVVLKMEWQREDYRLLLEGRADGIDKETYGSYLTEEQITFSSYLESKENKDMDQSLYYIDEIKGMYQNVMEFEEAKPLHLAQAKCYAAMYIQEKQLDQIGVQITYCNIETDEIKKFRLIYGREELEDWFTSLIDSYKMWADQYVICQKQKKESIDQLVFPFEYRDGQKKLLAMVYHSIIQKKSAFFQAPTGIGKTISTIYPALKTISQESGEKIYYLTAKTITRTVAEETIKILEGQGLSLKAVTITAKEKICSNDIFECNPLVCPRARGHFDRINGALYQLLFTEHLITRDTVTEYAERYQVCPYELSFEVAYFTDFVICDYNYVFDPHVNRNSLQNDGKNSILLIDEAHNLVERAREMYSANLFEADIVRLKKIIPKEEKRLQRKMNTCRKGIKQLKEKFLEDKQEGKWDAFVEYGDVDLLYFPLARLNESLLEYLTDLPLFEDREEAVEIFFRLRHFAGIMESMTEGYRIYGIWTEDGFMVRLFCIDPSAQLSDILKQNRASIFFSATLLPMPYYRNLLCDEGADAFAIPSPFDERKRIICITNDVTSKYSRRNEEEYRKIIKYLEKSLAAKKGNYMIFFPSYEMMEKTYDLLIDSKIPKMADVIMQESMMTEEKKEEFLSLFDDKRDKSLVGFCVLGSIFSEGIDLSGNRLIGVLIVGTGLPKVCSERDMIRNYFDSQNKKGYDYAYRYPGMNKVLQAAGRVIRSTGDVGIITLMDDRFLWRENQYLLPEDWSRFYEVNLHNYSQVLEQFWNGVDEVE